MIPNTKCVCCDRVIEKLSDETIPIGLDLTLGLVPDKCVLICNVGTTRLVEAKKLQDQVVNRRR
jgi:hypothetical protein